LATTKTPKSSTASKSKSGSRAAAPAAKKAAVAKKAATAKKSAAGAAPGPKSASKPGKAVLANREAAKRAARPAAKAAAKSTAKLAAKKPRSAAAAPVASPPQPKPRKPGKVSAPTDIVERLRLEVRRALEELKAKDVVELDVRGKTSIADYIVVAGGTSSRHVKSVADEVIKYAKKAGMQPLGVEGQREGEWVLVDLGDIIVHVMLPRVREFYGLERLWSVGPDADDAEAAYA